MSGARTRTMAHLAKMVALASGCSHETAVVTLPAQPSATTTAAPTASVTVAVTKSPPPPPPDDDMLVREPMHGHDPVGPPPPQHCASVAAATQATAAMHRTQGIFDVDVRVTLGGAAHATFVPSTNPMMAVQAYGAATVSANVTTTSAVVRLRLNMIADKAIAQLYVPLACAGGAGGLTVYLAYDRTTASVKVDRVESR
jgi:hypothetical protein